MAPLGVRAIAVVVVVAEAVDMMVMDEMKYNSSLVMWNRRASLVFEMMHDAPK
jgi:hypothetical protein